MPDYEHLWNRLMEILQERSYVPREHRDWFIAMAASCLNSEAFAPERQVRIRGLLLSTYMSEYCFDMAEKVATRLTGHTMQVWEAACALGTFFIQTRRYELAREVLQEALLCCEKGRGARSLRQQLADCEARNAGKKVPYKPMPRENREQVLDDFTRFLRSIGTDSVSIPRVVSQKPVQHKPGKSELMPGLRTFVAYDLETTGLSHAEDNITEIGAVRVTDGEIVAEFQQLIKPHSREIPPLVEELTGITNEMVAAAPHIRDVLPEFAAFLGDDMLMGYNNVHFDNKFLFRDANLFLCPIPNRTFDLLPWSKSLVSVFRLSPKGGLGALSRDLHIVNPQAHRALADAMTTARVYLKLLDMVEENQRSGK